MIILGIETSCDDTAVSVIKTIREHMQSISHVRFSQIKTHAKYGGVIPEVAAREHAVTIIPTLDSALKKARLTMDKIDIIAVTQGPGLAPALSVGIDTARVFSAIYKIPIVPVHHIEGHMLSVWPIKGIAGSAKTAPHFPMVSLVVSGGHTLLVLIKKIGSYKILGSTCDDAAGEAFDKVATLMELPYPGGPHISKLAKSGNRRAFEFPRPMMHQPNLDFSFSGLKTAVRYFIDARKTLHKKLKCDIAASFEEAVADVLVTKTEKAIQQYTPRSLSLVGGVSANSYLRKRLQRSAKLKKVQLYLAPPLLCQDNATMIAMVAGLHKTKGSVSIWKKLNPKPTWSVSS